MNEFCLVSIDVSAVLGNFFDLVGSATLKSSSGFQTPYYADPSSNLFQSYQMSGSRQNYQVYSQKTLSKYEQQKVPLT